MALSPSAALSRSSRSAPDLKATLPPASPAPPSGRRPTRRVRRPLPPIVWQRREAQSTDVAVRARTVAPSTVAMTASRGQQARDGRGALMPSPARQELTVADGEGLRRLPKEILALIAADASDRIESALTLFFTLTDRNDVAAGMSAHARDSKVRTAVEKGMLTHNPYLRFSCLVRDLTDRHIPGFRSALGSTLDEVRAVLRQQALDVGFTRDEVDVWLTREETVLQLVEKDLPKYYLLPDHEWTQALAKRTADKFDSLRHIPRRFISYAMCVRVVNSPRFDWGELISMPERHRTPAILDRAVLGDPFSIYAMTPAERTPARLTMAARGMTFEEFSRFLRSHGMLGDHLCLRLLAQLFPSRTSRPPIAARA
jgi:hypothetical protein